MDVLTGPIRHYAWGSHTAIAALQGRPIPTAEPEAELWLGAHPSGPARVAGAAGGAGGAEGRLLTDLIDHDPGGVLGQAAVRRFGRRLPFLMKVLAAAQPLSLQAHPTLDQARAGFAAEEAAGLALADPGRTYVDPWHKPELLVAVTDFDALCGFADPATSAAVLAGLRVPHLEPVLGSLRGTDPGQALHAAVRALLTWPEDGRQALVDAVVAAARPRAAEHPTYDLVDQLALRYPGDVGVVVATLLNRVRLAPGEAVWMPAGNLHAYLSGLGVEIMAASDNVVRGGLTPKAVNVPQLLRILRFEVLEDPVLRCCPVGPGLETWQVPVKDFALHRATLSGGTVRLPGGGARILLCLGGEVRCQVEGVGADRAGGRVDGAGGRVDGAGADPTTAALTLGPGRSALVPATDGAVTVAGVGEVFQASCGESLDTALT